MSEKNVNSDVLLDCWSCSHSQAGLHIPTQRHILICSLTLEECEKRCSDFHYEPGTDQSELENKKGPEGPCVSVLGIEVEQGQGQSPSEPHGAGKLSGKHHE